MCGLPRLHWNDEPSGLYSCEWSRAVFAVRDAARSGEGRRLTPAGLALLNLCALLSAGRATFRLVIRTAGASPQEIPADVAARWPEVLAIDFGSGTRDERLVELAGVERLEFWANFNSLGGERFFSVPVDRLVSIASVQVSAQIEAPTANDRSRHRFAGRDADLEAECRGEVEAEDLDDWAKLQETRAVLPFRRRAAAIPRSVAVDEHFVSPEEARLFEESLRESLRKLVEDDDKAPKPANEAPPKEEPVAA